MRCWRRRSDDACGFTFRATPRRSRSAPTRWRPRSRRRPRGAMSRSRSSAPARAGSTGSSRWSRSRRRPAASPTGRSTPADADGAARRPARRRRARAAARPDRRHSLAQAADAADLRALRHRRSALARRLSRPWRLQGLGQGAGAWPGRHRRGSRAIGPARPRRRRLPDRHQVAHGGADAGRRRNTSSATPTKATAAPSPTA